MPLNLERRNGESLNIFRKLSSVIISHSLVDRFNISGIGVKLISLLE